MKTVIRVPAKPHVAAFLKSAYGSPAQIPRKTLVYDLIELAIRANPENQYTGQLCDHHDLFILMHGTYANHSLPYDRAGRIAIALEKHFWNEAIKYIIDHLRLVPRSDKRRAIENFYDRFRISEDMYSYDSFRRRLVREEISNVNSRPEAPPMSRLRCVSNYDARMVYLYVTKDNLSYRQVGNLYGISKSSVEKIVKMYKKIFQTLS